MVVGPGVAGDHGRLERQREHAARQAGDEQRFAADFVEEQGAEEVGECGDGYVDGAEDEGHAACEAEILV